MRHISGSWFLIISLLRVLNKMKICFPIINKFNEISKISYVKVSCIWNDTEKISATVSDLPYVSCKFITLQRTRSRSLAFKLRTTPGTKIHVEYLIKSYVVFDVFHCILLYLCFILFILLFLIWLHLLYCIWLCLIVLYCILLYFSYIIYFIYCIYL
jgi:hypothetical protein